MGEVVERERKRCAAIVGTAAAGAGAAASEDSRLSTTQARKTTIRFSGFDVLMCVCVCRISEENSQPSFPAAIRARNELISGSLSALHASIAKTFAYATLLLSPDRTALTALS